MDAFIQWILDNWDTVCTNWKLFVSFGVVVCVATIAVVKAIYDNLLYKDLPEKRELQAQIEKLNAKIVELKAKNDDLEDERRKYLENEIFINGTKEKGNETAGEIIADAVGK